MTVVTQTDRPKSVRNRCVIEVFGGVFVLSRCFLDFSLGVGAFAIGLSQISSFFSFYNYTWLSQICTPLASFVIPRYDSRHIKSEEIFVRTEF